MPTCMFGSPDRRPDRQALAWAVDFRSAVQALRPTMERLYQYHSARSKSSTIEKLRAILGCFMDYKTMLLSKLLSKFIAYRREGISSLSGSGSPTNLFTQPKTTRCQTLLFSSPSTQ